MERLNGRFPPADIPPIVPILVGETAYNLRAALDYAVGQLSLLRIPKRRGDARKNQFPIEHSPQKFRKRRSTFLYGLDESDVKAIRQLQPFRGCHWTTKLAMLSNIDKHNNLVRLMPGIEMAFDHDQYDLSIRCDIRPFFVVGSRPSTPLIPLLEILESEVSAFLDALHPEFEV